MLQKGGKKKQPYWICLMAVLFLYSCAPEPQMRYWSSSKDYDREFKQILVMALANNVAIRATLENEMVEAANRERIETTNSMALFPPELGKPFEDIEKVKARLREKGFDGILTVAIIDVQAKRYIPPTANYEPMVFYDRFGNYYYQTYGLVYKPGYFQRDTQYYMEVNFYEIRVGELVWSGMSRTFVPSEFENFTPVFSRDLFRELVGQNIITR